MFVIVCLLGASMYAEDRARASEASVPITMQVSLVRRIAAYDRTLRARAGDAVRIVVASYAGSAVSERSAGQIARELDDLHGRRRRQDARTRGPAPPAR
jgi:hypothetical protein